MRFTSNLLRSLVFILAILSSIFLHAQNIGINVDGSDPDPSAILDIKSDEKGLLVPRMSSVQRVSIPAPAEGLMVYDTTTSGFWVYSSVGWELLAGDDDWTISGDDVYRDAGKVGIGTSTPTQSLHIAKTATEKSLIHFEDDDDTSISGVTTLSAPYQQGTGWSAIPGRVDDLDGAYWESTGMSGGSSLLRVRFAENSSVIPTGATIDGVEVKVWRARHNAIWVQDWRVKLTVDNLDVGADKAYVGSNWTTSYTPRNYGSSTDSWAHTITPEQVNSGQLGFYFGVIGEGQQVGFSYVRVRARIDKLEFKVHWSLDGAAPDDWVAGSSEGQFVVSQGNDVSSIGNSALSIGRDNITTLSGLKISGGAADGRVLTSSASGEASWQVNQPDTRWINTTYGMRNTSGRVGVGRTPDDYQFEVQGSASIDGGGASVLTMRNYLNSIGGPRLFMYHMRGTEAAPLATASGDILGQIYFGGLTSNGVTRTGPQIEAFASENWEQTTYGGGLNFYTRASGETANIIPPKMVLAPNGNLGLGIQDPTARLHLAGNLILNLPGAETLGQVLTTDAVGNATWQDLPASGDADTSPTNELQTIIAGNGLLGGGGGTSLTLDVQAGNGLSIASDGLRLGGAMASNVLIEANASDFQIQLNGSNADFEILDDAAPVFKVDGGGGVVTFNESGSATADVVMQSDVNSSMFFIDASANRIGVNEAAPQGTMHISDDSGTGEGQLHLTENSANDGARVYFYNAAETTNSWTMYGRADNTQADNSFGLFSTAASSYVLRMYANDVAGFHMSSPTFALHLPNNVTSGLARANAWSTYSDGRIKSEILPLQSAIAQVRQLSPKRFIQHASSFEMGKLEVDRSSGSQKMGFIAQELYEIVPEAVQKPEDESKQLWGVDYTALIPLLTKAIQEQQAQIADLQALSGEQSKLIEQLLEK